MPTNTQIPIPSVLFVMVIAGMFGGLAGNLARRLKVAPEPPEGPPAAPSIQPAPEDELVTDVVKGLMAAFCVPIFLALAQSDLFVKPENGIDFGLNFLYLGGYCLIAAYSAQSFLDGLSGRVLNNLVSGQKKQADHLETLDDQMAEVADTTRNQIGRPVTGPQTSGTGIGSVGFMAPGHKLAVKLPKGEVQTVAPSAEKGAKHHEAGAVNSEKPMTMTALSANELAVLQALNGDGYGRYSLSTTSTASRLSKSSTREALAKLIEKGLVTVGQSRINGVQLYEITAHASQALSQLENE